jgi:PAS domain S-box-containing protein
MASSSSLNGNSVHNGAETRGALINPISADDVVQLSGDGMRIEVGEATNDFVRVAQRANRAAQAESSVDLSEHLSRVHEMAFSAEPRLRLIHRSTSACFVTPEQARHIGLLMHEVVANAIKHAHPSGIDVEVTLEYSRLADGRQIVVMSDDGIGLPEDMNPYLDGGAGFRKIRALADTMSAELRIESDSLGSTFTVTLPATARHDAPHGDAHFRKILDELPTAIYATDTEGRISYFNEAAATLWGCRPEIGKTQWSGANKLYWPDGRELPLAESPLALAIKEKRQISGMEAVVERPDGTRIRCLPHATPLFSSEGSFVGAVNFIRDLSERTRAEELALRLAAIVESSDDAILSKNLDGIIMSWNGGCQRLFGYTAEEAIGRSVTMLIPEDRPDEEPMILSRLRRGQKIDHYETVRRRKDGSLVDISLTVSPIKSPDGRVVGASKVARDITEQKRAAEKQSLLLGEMRHRVKNLSAVIEALARQSTPRNDPKIDAFVDDFMGRVRALLSTGELTLGSPTRTVELYQLLEKVLRPFGDANGGDDRIALVGPRLVLAERTAGSLALAFHELATNSLKYGALKVANGRVGVEWSIRAIEDGGRRVQIVWKETGGKRLKSKPTRSGFGSRVISQAIARERDAKTELRFEPDGVDA